MHKLNSPNQHVSTLLANLKNIELSCYICTAIASIELSLTFGTELYKGV